MKERRRIEVLDTLRGIASLSVALFHFGNILNPGALRAVLSYGWLGVEVFFVISGFIIPYSLYYGGYRLGRFPLFLVKRVVRLDPPYVVTILLILALGVLSWYVPLGATGETFHVTTAQVLLHLGYLNAFFHYEWLSDVFWTLAIEFQYYILIGLVFPLVVSGRQLVRYGAMCTLGALAFLIPSDHFVFYFIFLFLIGITVFQYRTGLVGGRRCAVQFIIAAACCLVRAGLAITLAGTLAGLSILFLRARNRVLTFLGNISYSLYLLHSPVGRRALNVALRLTGAGSEAGKVSCIVFAVAVSIAASYVMYRLVEGPSQQWSGAIRYDRRTARAERAGARQTPEEVEQMNPAF